MAASFPSVPELFQHRVSSTPDAEAFATPAEDGWQRLTWLEVGRLVQELSCGLHALGIEPEQRCAILCTTRLEWVLADLAILCAGGAVVPLYPTASQAESIEILADSGATLLFTEDADTAHQLAEHRSRLPALQHIIVIDSQGRDRAFTSIAELRDQGREWGVANPDAYAERLQAIQPDHIATLMYTSGTTGRPKGATITHDCWVFEAEAMDALGFLSPADKHFLWLPLSHSFGMVLLIASIRIGIPTTIDGQVDRFLDNLQRLQPTFTAAVPSIFEQIHARITREARQAGGLRARAFRWAMDVGAEASALQQIGQPLTGLLTVRHALAEQLVFSRIRSRFGGKLRFFISGSAPLSPDLSRFFHAAGVLILEGYGLTESAAATTVNRPDRYRFGTVGLPLSGVELRLDPEDSEVLIRSRGVMRGYHNLPEQTAAVLDEDGWLRTGDIGAIDEDGFLRIVDRKKDLIKTSSGKIVAPQKIEGRLRTICPYIEQVFVSGNNRSFCVALVTLESDAVAFWAKEAGLEHLSLVELAAHEHIRALLEPYIDQINVDLARYEAIRAFAILPESFSLAAGELTASLKLRRKTVESRYKSLLDQLYASDAPS